MKKAAVVLTGLLLAGCASAPSSGPHETDLALGRPITSNGHIYDFAPANAVDGDVLSYYEGPANTYPNIVTVDLGAASQVDSMKVRLNPKRIWQARTQTFEVSASDDGTNFAVIVPSAPYEFDPQDNQNTVEIAWKGKTRYLRLTFTANTEATAGQIGEWEIWGQ
jgi:hypothetical protein